MKLPADLAELVHTTPPGVARQPRRCMTLRWGVEAFGSAVGVPTRALPECAPPKRAFFSCAKERPNSLADGLWPIAHVSWLVTHIPHSPTADPWPPTPRSPPGSLPQGGGLGSRLMALGSSDPVPVAVPPRPRSGPRVARQARDGESSRAACRGAIPAGVPCPPPPRPPSLPPASI